MIRPFKLIKFGITFSFLILMPSVKADDASHGNAHRVRNSIFTQKNVENHVCEKEFLGEALKIINENKTSNTEIVNSEQVDRLKIAIASHKIFKRKIPKILNVNQLIHGNKPYLDVSLEDASGQFSTVRIAQDIEGQKIEVVESRIGSSGYAICSERILTKVLPKAQNDEPRRRRFGKRNEFEKSQRRPISRKRNSPSQMSAYEKRNLELKESEDKPLVHFGKEIDSKGTKLGIIESDAVMADGSGQAGFMGAGLSTPITKGKGKFTIGVGAGSYGDAANREAETMGVVSFQFNENPFKKE